MSSARFVKRCRSSESMDATRCFTNVWFTSAIGALREHSQKAKPSPILPTKQKTKSPFTASEDAKSTSPIVVPKKQAMENGDQLLRIINLRPLQLIRVIDIHRLPRSKEVDRLRTLAVPVAGMLHAPKRHVH